MNTCKSCGIEIPNRQKFCSVCYGDPFYGTDGYLLAQMQQDFDAQREREESQQSESE